MSFESSKPHDPYAPRPSTHAEMAALLAEASTLMAEGSVSQAFHILSSLGAWPVGPDAPQQVGPNVYELLADRGYITSFMIKARRALDDGNRKAARRWLTLALHLAGLESAYLLPPFHSRRAYMRERVHDLDADDREFERLLALFDEGHDLNDEFAAA